MCQTLNSFLIGLNQLFLFNLIGWRSKLLALVTFKKLGKVYSLILPTQVFSMLTAYGSNSTRIIAHTLEQLPFSVHPLSPALSLLPCPRSFHPSHLMWEPSGISDLKGPCNWQATSPIQNWLFLNFYRAERIEERGRDVHRHPEIPGEGRLVRRCCEPETKVKGRQVCLD